MSAACFKYRKHLCICDLSNLYSEYFVCWNLKPLFDLFLVYHSMPISAKDCLAKTMYVWGVLAVFYAGVPVWRALLVVLGLRDVSSKHPNIYLQNIFVMSWKDV